MATAVSGAQKASAAVQEPQPKKMTAAEIDQRCELLAGHEDEAAAIRAELKKQVELYGFNPARSKASTRRIETPSWKLTVSTSSETEIFDDQVEKIKTSCMPDLFERIFKAKVKYSVAGGATELLAQPKLPDGAPKNLRVLFSQAVLTKDKSPSLRIEELHGD